MNAPRPRLRLLHTSDVHVAGNYHTPKVGEHGQPCLCPVLAVLGAVAEHRPDLVIVAGDLFDHARVKEEHVAATLALFAALPMPTVLINGNHDVHDATSPYGRFQDVVRSSGVLFLAEHDGDGVTLFDGALHLWGKAMPEHSPAYRPLHGVPSRPAEGWYVVAAHGHYTGDEIPSAISRSSPITNEDIVATKADYIALGHWHVPTDVSHGDVTAWYCGSPLDIGRNGFVNIVDLDPDSGVTVASTPVAPPEAGCA